MEMTFSVKGQSSTHILNAISPAFTASFALADLIIDNNQDNFNEKIKALLLSAGFGTRLRPLTLKTPKCLVKVNGVPLLSHWLLKLEKLGCEEVIINTHYLSHKVLDF